jgi:UDP-N-acetylmuramoyl-tripeptide--D-alanyl-D-alanine ligase
MNESDTKTIGVILVKLERTAIKGISIDSRTVRKGELFVAIKGNRFDGHDFVAEAIKKGAWGAVVERSAFETRYGAMAGLKNIFPVEDTLFSLQEMATMHRRKFSIPLVGITGSNGKTTTKEMVASILKEKGPVLKSEGNLNNHIGVPLTLLRLDKEHKSAVIEMGMSAGGEIETLARIAGPDVGVITNVGPAHLEFLGSTDTVARAKGELLETMSQQGTAVLNADDRYFETLRSMFTGSICSFGIVKQAQVTARDIEQGADFTDFTISSDGVSVKVRLRAVGMHNVSNALAAAAAALAVGIPMESVRLGLEDFLPVAMRSELRRLKGRIVLADCYNANPGSMEAALETLASLKGSGKTVAVLGDMLELGEISADAHRAVGASAARLGVDVLVAMGSFSRFTAEGARQAGMSSAQVFEAASAADVAALLQEHSGNGDAVLIKGSRGMKMENILEEF